MNSVQVLGVLTVKWLYFCLYVYLLWIWLYVCIDCVFLSCLDVIVMSYASEVVVLLLVVVYLMYICLREWVIGRGGFSQFCVCSSSFDVV